MKNERARLADACGLAATVHPEPAILAGAGGRGALGHQDATGEDVRGGHPRIRSQGGIAHVDFVRWTLGILRDGDLLGPRLEIHLLRLDRNALPGTQRLEENSGSGNRIGIDPIHLPLVHDLHLDGVARRARIAVPVGRGRLDGALHPADADHHGQRNDDEQSKQLGHDGPPFPVPYEAD